MIPATDNIVIEQGATFSRQYRFKDSSGAPLNMSGHEVEAQIWTHLKTAKLADFTIVWEDRARGEFKITLPASVTRNIEKSASWDMLITEPDGVTKNYWLRGKTTISVGYTE